MQQLPDRQPDSDFDFSEDEVVGGSGSASAVLQQGQVRNAVAPVGNASDNESNASGNNNKCVSSSQASVKVMGSTLPLAEAEDMRCDNSQSGQSSDAESQGPPPLVSSSSSSAATTPRIGQSRVGIQNRLY